MTKEEIKKVKRSYSRCFTGGKDFIQHFYNFFLESHPKIKVLFENTDFKQQKLLLRQGIHCFIMYAEGVFAGDFCLDEITESHNRKNYNIPPEMYRFWKQSLLQALQQQDKQFDEELVALWSEVIDKGIAHISKGY